MKMRTNKNNMNRELIVLVFASLLAISIVLAANDPGHDTLYIEQQGDSEVNGTFNVSYNTSFKGGKSAMASYLDIYANGATIASPSINTIAGTSTNLYIDSPGNLYFNSYSADGTVYLGDSGDTVNLNVSGGLYVMGSAAVVNGKNICLADGTNCPATLGGANATGSGTAGYLAMWKNASTLNSSGIFYNNSNVGIGTTTPNATLHVIGNINSTTNISAPMICLAGSCQTSWPASGGSGTGNVNGSGTTFYIPMWNGTTTLNNSAIYQYNSNIGIGTATATQLLDVNGSINISDPNGALYTSLVCFGENCINAWSDLYNTHNHSSATIRAGTYAINISGTAAEASDLVCTDCIGTTEISDSYLLNNGDDATGDYSFDTDTFVIDSTDHMIGIGITNPTDILTVNLTGPDLSKNMTFLLNNSETFKIRNNGAGGSVRLESSQSIILQPNGGVTGGGVYISNSSGSTYHAYISAYSTSNSYFNAYGGNLGIGTTSPTGYLHVNAAGALKTFRLTYNGGGAGYGNWAINPFIYGVSNTGMEFVDGLTNVTRLVIQQTGNVGIGTTAPAVALEVAGGIRMNTTAAKPTCDSSVRGTMWYYNADAGINDTLYTCMKNSANSYNWVVVALG